MAAEHAACQEQLAELRHALLVATDRAVGAEAELSRLKGAEAARDRALAAAKEAVAERDALRKRLAAVHASQTWRVGRLVVGPAARLTRRVKR